MPPMDRKRARARPSAEAIKIALAWDSLPAVSQDLIREIIDVMRRLEDHHPIVRQLCARADPKRVRVHERRMERYQATHRGKAK